MNQELFDQQVVTEQHEEQNASPWPLQNSTTTEETERQIRLRTRVAEYLEAQRRLEIEITRQAEAQRIREEQQRLEEERKKLVVEVKEEKEKGVGQHWDKTLISLVRKAMPNLIAYDICGVQPMTGPTGLIFAMKSKYEKEFTDKSVDTVVNGSDRGTWEENHPWSHSSTVNSATRKKQAEEAAVRREEMRQDYLRRRKGYPVILESKESRLTEAEMKALDEPRNRETIFERLREKWGKIIDGTQNW